MAGSDTHGPSSSPSLEKQFEDFRVQLEESGGLRERIRAVVMEIESTTRLMYASLLLVHQSRPTPGDTTISPVQYSIFFFVDVYHGILFVFCLVTEKNGGEKVVLVERNDALNLKMKFKSCILETPYEE